MSELRKLILKVLLWSLGLAAIAGVLAVLVANDIIWRIVGTGMLTAAAALVTLPLSYMADRKKMRSAGLFGLVVVVVEFLLVLALIWDLQSLLPVWRSEENVLMTIGAVGGASVAATLLLLAAQRPDTRVAGMAGLGLTGAFFVAAMIGSWVPRQWLEKWWATAWIIAICGALAVAALIGTGTGDRRYWRWLGVAASAVAAYMLIAAAWTSAADWETMSLFVATGVYVAFANLVMRVPLQPGQGWLRIGTLLAGAATAVLSELIVFDFDDEIVTRSDAAAAILASCGTLALVVLARLNRRVDFEPLPHEMRHITVFCPRCRKKQSLELGAAACKACGLRIEVRAEEPRCAQCGYLLYKLTSDVCPECGASIRPDALSSPE